MASPWWSYPGVYEGRLDPLGSVAVGGAYGYGYTPAYGYIGPGYGYSYSGAYGYFSEHVFCLGKDRSVAPYHRIKINETARVEQSLIVTTPHVLLLFSFHMRVASAPASRNVVEGGTVSFMAGAGAGGNGLITTDGGSSGVVIMDPGSGSGKFLDADSGLLCTITGATDATNNGQHLVDGVPIDQGNASDGNMAVLTNQNTLGAPAPLTGGMIQRLNDPGVTVRMHGVNWVGRAYCDWGSGWQERVVLQEWIGHNYIRAGLALHVSQYTGPLSVRFELKAELAP